MPRKRIAVQCPECGHRYDVAADLLSSSVICPRCEKSFVVSRADSAREALEAVPVRNRHGLMFWAAVASSGVGGAAVLLAAVLVGSDGKVVQAVAGSAASTDAPWNDARTVECGNVRVEVVNVFTTGDITVKDSFGEFYRDNSKVLGINLRLTNTTAARMLSYSGFLSDRPTLKDDFGNQYRFVTWSLGRHPQQQKPRGAKLYPGEPVDDLLVFDCPVQQASCLFLELPARPLEEHGSLRFRIPVTIRQ